MSPSRALVHFLLFLALLSICICILINRVYEFTKRTCAHFVKFYCKKSAHVEILYNLFCNLANFPLLMLTLQPSMVYIHSMPDYEIEGLSFFSKYPILESNYAR
jgi:hypothetical protein